MLTTSDEAIWHRAWSFKDHGKSYDAVYRRQHTHGYRWLHESFGTNWRLTEIQSAIGRVVLRKLPEWVERRRQNAAKLAEHFARFSALRTPVPPAEIRHSYYKFYTFVRPERLRPGWDRDRLVQAIAAEGVPCFSGSCGEIYLEKAFPQEWRPSTRLPIARELAETSLMFLVHPTLKAEHIGATCSAVEKVMRAAPGQFFAVAAGTSIGAPQ